MKRYSEAELIKACKDNSRKHQEHLYLSYFDKMYGMCLRHTSDETIAMSVVNDGFMKVFKSIGKFQSKGSFEGWIRKIVYNSICDYYRKKSNNHKFIELEDKEKTTEIYNSLEYEEIIDLVNTLPESSKSVFILHAIEGYNHKEIAELKNIPIGTSKWYLSKAKEQLKKLLANRDILYLNA